jgi:hypothetical protein
MKHTFLAPARADLREAIRFYEERRLGLGAELVEEVKATITKILSNPEAWPRVLGVRAVVGFLGFRMP